MSSDDYRADSKPNRAPGVLRRHLGRETLLYDTRRSRLHVLNATAAEIWCLCDGVHSVAAIRDRLETAFSDVTETLDQDLRELLTSLAEQRLLLTSS